MYTDSDIEAAVAAGAISAEAAAALRDFVASRQGAPAVDEEHFRLVTGFNDIFVSIASVLLLIAVGWLGAMVTSAVGAAVVAATSWGLAEYFTRRRRMALPSILLLVTFAAALFLGTRQAIDPAWFALKVDTPGSVLSLPVAAAVTVIGTWLHWRRFHVPITVAAGAVAVVVALFMLLFYWLPHARGLALSIALLAGLGVFAFAMGWDMSDRARTTRRSDVAFWLHLAAAPMIVHPVFSMLGLLTATRGELGAAVVAILIYVVLAVDRRALLVSALFYVLYAIATLFDAAGAVSTGIALTGLVIGGALLMLSAFWHPTRAVVVRALPARLRAFLPPVDADRPAPAAAGG